MELNLHRWYDEATCSFFLYSKQIVGEEHFLFLAKSIWDIFQAWERHAIVGK